MELAFHLLMLMDYVDDEDACQCIVASRELLHQYLLKARTGSKPVLTPETQNLLCRLEAGEFAHANHH